MNVPIEIALNLDLQKEEVKRRKNVTDRLIQSEKKIFADLLSD